MDLRHAPPRPLVLIAALLFLSSTVWFGEWFSDPNPSDAALTVDAALAVATSVAFPLIRFGSIRATLALVIVSAFVPTVAPVAATGVLGVALTRRLPVALAIGTGGVLAQVGLGVWRPVVGVGVGWWAIIVVAGYAAVIGWGAWYQARGALLANLEERARRAESEQVEREAAARRSERERIAREMHDVLGHRLSVLATTAGAIGYVPDSPPEDLARAAETIRASARAALDELRLVIGVLQSGTDEPVDWPSHTRPALEALRTLVEEWRSAGADITVDASDLAEPSALVDAVGRTAYRIVQEALTNAAKHAPGEPAAIELRGRPGGSLDVAVTNPSRSSTAGEAEPLPSGGTGLVGMAERVELAGGRFEADARNGMFVVTASIPWPE